MRKLTTLLLATLTTVAGAQLTPWRSETVEVSEDKPRDIVVTQGETYEWRWHYTQGGRPIDLTGAQTAAMTWGKGSKAYQAPGTILDPTGGVVRAVWASTNATPAGVYSYIVSVSSNDVVLARARGSLTVSRGLPAGGDIPAWAGVSKKDLERAIEGIDITESDPVALPRIAAIEAVTNDWNLARKHSIEPHGVAHNGAIYMGVNANAETVNSVVLGSWASVLGDAGVALGANSTSAMLGAIQLGAGINPDPFTLQIYDHQLLDAQGNIPYARMQANLPAESDPVATRGGYASADFWLPAATPISSDNSGIIRDNADVKTLLLENAVILDMRLYAQVDDRPLDHALTPPTVTWAQTTGQDIAILHSNILHATGQPGSVQITADAGARGTKTLRVPFASAIPVQVLENPYLELPGTWRYGIASNVVARFINADTNMVSLYRYHRDTVYGDMSDAYFPDALQLYETGGKNTEKVLPDTVNKSFFWPELADALRCVTAWRGDWYAHAPYVAVSPHYAVSVAHWPKSYTQTYWCIDRDAEQFEMIQWDAGTGKDGTTGWRMEDIELHRLASPAPAITKVMRSSELRKLSPSMLAGTAALTHTSHNTIALKAFQPSGGMPVSMAFREWNDAYGYGECPVVFLDPSVRKIPPLGTPEGDATPLGWAHNTHLWESGHPSFWWLDGNLVLIGTYTFGSGGPNSFLKDDILDSLDAFIRADSNGAEGLTFLTAGDLQP